MTSARSRVVSDLNLKIDAIVEIKVRKFEFYDLRIGCCSVSVDTSHINLSFAGSVSPLSSIDCSYLSSSIASLSGLCQ